MKWTVHDDNDDQMVYSVLLPRRRRNPLAAAEGQYDRQVLFLRRLAASGWRLHGEDLASDAPSHSPGQALTSNRDSARFEVDTTPPRIEDLKASVEGSQIHVSFRAADGFSNIERAEYSVDAADWQYVEPVGQLADSKSASYDFQVAVPAAQKDVRRACCRGAGL